MYTTQGTIMRISAFSVSRGDSMTYVFIGNKVIYQINSKSESAERTAISWAEQHGYTVINVDDNPFGGSLIYVR